MLAITLFKAFESQNANSTMLMIDTPVNKPTAPPEIKWIYIHPYWYKAKEITTDYPNLILDGESGIPLDLHDIGVEKLNGELHSFICKKVETVLQNLLFGKATITRFLLLQLFKGYVFRGVPNSVAIF